MLLLCQVEKGAILNKITSQYISGDCEHKKTAEEMNLGGKEREMMRVLQAPKHLDETFRKYLFSRFNEFTDELVIK